MTLSTFSLRSNLYHWLAALVSGVLLVLSFPKFNWSFLAWIALAPLLFVLPGQSLRKAFGLGWLTGWVFFFFSANWISHSMIRYGGLNVVLAYAIAALFTAITGLFVGLFALATTQLIKSFGLRALGLAPLLWAATEWVRGSTTGITWNALGLSQVNQFQMAGLASWGGVELVSLPLVAASVVLVLLPQFKQVAIRRVLMLYLFIAAVFAIAYAAQGPSLFTLVKIASPPIEVTVAGIQPNLPVDIPTHPDEMTARNVSGLETNIKLTGEAINQTANKKADVIIWAESPLVLNYEQDEATRTKLNEVAKEYNAYVIFSALGRDGESIYNSAQTISPEGRALQRYDKIRLLPFGEYVPFRALLGYFVPPMVGDFTPGSKAVVNSLRLNTQLAIVQNEQETQGEIALERTTNFVRTGTFICYEAAYPNLVREFVNNGAALLINISDDAWFGNSAGAEQHLNHARLRAIENHRDIVRVTNSGISALVTAQGKVVDPLPMFTAASHVWTAETSRTATLYTKYGDWFAISCTIISALAIIASFIYHSRAPKSQT